MYTYARCYPRGMDHIVLKCTYVLLVAILLHHLIGPQLGVNSQILQWIH